MDEVKKTQLKVRWMDDHREPRCDPNPLYPDGVDLDLRINPEEPSCATDLPYPARRCGMFVIDCLNCGIKVGVTTAGRADDPRSVIIQCQSRPQ